MFAGTSRFSGGLYKRETPFGKRSRRTFEDPRNTSPSSRCLWCSQNPMAFQNEARATLLGTLFVENFCLDRSLRSFGTIEEKKGQTGSELSAPRNLVTPSVAKLTSRRVARDLESRANNLLLHSLLVWSERASDLHLDI